MQQEYLETNWRLGAEAEEERLRTLQDYALLDTLPEGRFDGIVTLAANFLKAPMALFSLVDGDRIWFKARFGTDAIEVDRDLSFCAHTATHDEVLIVEDAQRDERFAKNCLVQGKPNIRFYAGVPIHARNGHVLGTLCVVDVVPRSISNQEIRALESFAREIETQVEFRQLMNQQQRLFDERAILTDMIVHDASGMVAALRWNFELLESEAVDRAAVLAQCRGAADELMRLCESVLHRNEDRPRAIVTEIKSTQLRVWLDSLCRRIERMAREADISFELSNDLPEQPIETDASLLERIILNLVRNAIQACPPGSRILIRAGSTGDAALECVVADDGPGVPEALAERIFEPYFSYREGGTGLGLAICRQGARALGGSIRFKPREPHGAEFIVSLPWQSA